MQYEACAAEPEKHKALEAQYPIQTRIKSCLWLQVKMRLGSHEDAALGDLLALLQLGVRVAHLELRALPQLKVRQWHESSINTDLREH
jgi:hypothetical protein